MFGTGATIEAVLALLLLLSPEIVRMVCGKLS